MTPVELSIEAALNIEVQRFHSDWLFKWHGMTYEGGSVDVEDFRGGRISYAGIYFGDQQQTVFWQAVDRYLKQKVHSTFKLWEAETQTYSLASRRISINGIERSLGQFSALILAKASDTASVLRGDNRSGTPTIFLAAEQADWAQPEASRLAAAHRAMIDRALADQIPVGSTSVSHWTWIETFFSHNKGLIWFGGVLIAALGAAAHFLTR